MHRPYVCIHAVCTCAHADKRRLTASNRARARSATAVHIPAWCTFPNVIIFARGLVRAFVTSVSRALAHISRPLFLPCLPSYRLCTPQPRCRRHRRSRGFSRQYANAFRQSGGWIKKAGKEAKRRESEDARARERERVREATGTVGKNGRIETARGGEAAVVIVLLAVYIIHARRVILVR